MGRRSAATAAALATLVCLTAPGASAMPVDPPPAPPPAPRVLLPQPSHLCVVPADTRTPVVPSDPCGGTQGPRTGLQGPSWCVRQTFYSGKQALPTCPPVPVPQQPPAVPAH